MFGSCKPPNPINDFSTCRSVKSTPLHKSQAESGAVFEQQLNLFERAAWFDNSPVDDDYGKTSSAPPDSKIISGCGFSAAVAQVAVLSEQRLQLSRMCHRSLDVCAVTKPIDAGYSLARAFGQSHFSRRKAWS